MRRRRQTSTESSDFAEIREICRSITPAQADGKSLRDIGDRGRPAGIGRRRLRTGSGAADQHSEPLKRGSTRFGLTRHAKRRLRLEVSSRRSQVLGVPLENAAGTLVRHSTGRLVTTSLSAGEKRRCGSSRKHPKLVVSFAIGVTATTSAAARGQLVTTRQYSTNRDRLYGANAPALGLSR